MAHHWSDNVHTTAFTPRDYQVELLAAARERNTIVCLSHNSSREFIALKLLQECAYEIRRNVNRKVSIYISASGNGESAYNVFHYLTDLTVSIANQIYSDDSDKFENVFKDNQVIIITRSLFYSALVCNYIEMKDINLIIIEDCQQETHDEMQYLADTFFKFYEKEKEKPKILVLDGPIHSSDCVTVSFRTELELMEKVLYCKAETASDIVTVLRYCPKPTEFVVQCAPPCKDQLTDFLQDIILNRRAFIKEHRFDPSEIYGDDLFSEELKAIPDPKKEPVEFLDIYLDVLNEMGPWCADRCALNLLMQIEKQKVKTPYERHFLLLCLISTVFVEIRAHCEYLFQMLPNEKVRIETYSSPKVIRLLEILRLFKPEEDKSNEKTDAASIEKHEALVKISEEIDVLDFQKVQTNLDTTIKDIEESENNILSLETENLENILKIVGNNNNEELDKEMKPEEGESSSKLVNQTTPTISSKRVSSTSSIVRSNNAIKSRHKRKFAPNGHRNRHNNNPTDPDALCGILFCNDKNTAKILYNLLHEIGKNDPDLKFLSVQFTVDRVANPLTEPKEAEMEHRVQEEVLKRFRMHECNMLIGTAVLEEGIDLPKCNLVIRWDPPKSYRSYVQCKGRARAPQAYHIILVGPKLTLDIDSKNEFLSDKNHAYICKPGKEESSDDDDDDSLSEENEKIDNEKTIKMNGFHDISNNSTDTFEVENLDDLLENRLIELETSTASISEVVETKPFACVVKLDDESLISDSLCDSAAGAYEVKQATAKIGKSLAIYSYIEAVLLARCSNSEPPDSAQFEADTYNECIAPYKPIPDQITGAAVSLGTAVALVNKYCAKLPSDTFTKLTPLWRCAKTVRFGKDLYQYTIRLPINSPLKQDIIGLPMPTKMLARRVAALIACRELHRSGELDDNLQPIGKEGFKAAESDWEDFDLEQIDEQIVNENAEPRPGTTKRRQYYYKRIASAFSDCRPTVGTKAYLYNIKMTLECPIPEEQNTRGRKIYPPEDANQGFGILTLKKIPKVSAFPIFTRSGEVRVSLELFHDDISLEEDQIERINTFLNYTFTNVLRLQKFLMLFDPEAAENSFFIVPTIRTGGNNNDNNILVDWNFLELIFRNSEKMPKPVPEEDRKNVEFDPNKFRDAVVMPWYRNQDQPQYFYVAEICNHLSPQSSFPGENYSTFQEYYFRKYGITIQNTKQPLLDVDHTSARLNFLTPRYVNRKGVALPTSSEETKRAKRENLEQKQILVPELCTIHPFPASLWRAAVCLPCILYRINALLLADEIRKQVSYDLGLGKMDIKNENFEWPILDFGWSLAEVLKKSREAKLVPAEINSDTAGNSENNKTEKKKSDVEKAKDNVNAALDDKNLINENDLDKNNEKILDGEKTVNDILEEADEKLKSECLLEIGTWSNDMAENINYNTDDVSGDEWAGLLPPNVNLCSRNNTKIRYGSPTSWEVSATNNHNDLNNYYTDSDASFQSDDEYDAFSLESNENQSGPIRIEFKSDNLAEAVETEEEILKRQKQLEFMHNTKNENKTYESRNLYYFKQNYSNIYDNDVGFHESIFENFIKEAQASFAASGNLVEYDKSFHLPKKEIKKIEYLPNTTETYSMLIPYLQKENISNFLNEIGLNSNENDSYSDFKITLDNLYELNELYLSKSESGEEYEIEGTGDIFDNFNDSNYLSKYGDKKLIKIKYKNSSNIKSPDNNITETNLEKISILNGNLDSKYEETVVNMCNVNNVVGEFSFDYQPNLYGHPGPSPSIILQALTMSNANDGINLERLETIGDSFLKYAITTYLYCTYENVHEGKLSHLRSKQVSNLNLYRLGRKKILGESMIATKFEPHDNWLPPCYYVPKELEKALIEARIPACHWNLADLPNIKELSSEEICKLVRKKAESLGLLNDTDEIDELVHSVSNSTEPNEDFPCFIPYNLVTQHSIPDKSVADCVEALIGAYLIECGPRGALLFMAWLGIRVLPVTKISYRPSIERIPGSTQPNKEDNNQIIIYGEWSPPKSPLLTFAPNPHETLEFLLDGFSAFENAIGYNFKDRSYLLQAMTHASYSPNRLTDCYQRLEFLGDAVLDYLITRHLYEDPRQHSPGALTDLRSALVNNTIFASLAVRHGFHKYFRHLSPGLNEVIERFVRIQHENGHSISEEYYLLSEEECDEAEDVEVPKALGDVFESVAGAIFLDSSMSLDTVWKVYSSMMRPEIEQFSSSVPKSPIRELLELEPETAKFSKPEKLADGRRVRVTVEVFGKGIFRGIGRNYRIAKCTAAKCALRQLKKQGLISKKH